MHKLKNIDSEHRGTFPSVDAFAQHIGISRKSAYDGLRNGSIPCIRLGKRFIIPRAAIAEWLRTAGQQSSIGSGIR
jgi:excisionase family DNA binding protein